MWRRTCMRSPRGIRAFGTAAMLLVAARAGATPHRTPCARVHVEGDLSPTWEDELARVCADMAHWRDIDQGARLGLRMLDDGADVEVRSSDGRVAHRHVAAPADLWLVIEALIVVPPAAAVESPPRASRGDAAMDAGDGSPAPPAPSASAFHIELGGSGTGRVSGSAAYLSAGVEAWAGFRSRSWVLGMLARWDGFEAPVNAQPGFEMDTAGAGFLVARRFRSSPGVGVDAGLSAELLTERQSVDVTGTEPHGEATDVRAGTLGRLILGGEHLAFTLGLEAELSPQRVRRSRRADPDLPPLPAWSVGLTAGVMGEP